MRIFKVNLDGVKESSERARERESEHYRCSLSKLNKIQSQDWPFLSFSQCLALSHSEGHETLVYVMQLKQKCTNKCVALHFEGTLMKSVCETERGTVSFAQVGPCLC